MMVGFFIIAIPVAVGIGWISSEKLIERVAVSSLILVIYLKKGAMHGAIFTLLNLLWIVSVDMISLQPADVSFFTAFPAKSPCVQAT